MNEKEINEDFDREYEKYKNSPEYNVNLKVVTDTTTQYYKIKMPTYYIAKHSDEDLRAAVLAEREACAKLLDDWGKVNWNIWDCVKAIRARSDEMKDGIALASIAHPEVDPVPDDHEINPDSLETVEIEIPMNERIKQLAEQSGLGFLYNDNWRCETEIQHFAELICQDYANQFITDAERDENIRSEERRHLAGHYSAIVRDAVLAEREACAKLLEDFSKTGMVPVKDTWRMGLIAGANAIRGRTE